jgi:hypothetical protein
LVQRLRHFLQSVAVELRESEQLLGPERDRGAAVIFVGVLILDAGERESCSDPNVGEGVRNSV